MKQTEKEELPNGWEVVSIGEIFNFKNGLNKEKEFFGQGTPIVNYKDVYRETALNRSNVLGKVTVDDNELERYNVEKGDVFFTRTSETVKEIAFSAVVMEDIPNAVFSGFVLRARDVSEKLDNNFKRYCFNGFDARKEIIRKSTYTTRALTNGTVLSEVKLLIPPIEEQRLIGKILSQWDEAIETTQSLIEKLKLRKKGLMQELLSGKKRLPGFTDEWSEEPLGKFIRYTPRPKEKPKNHYLALGLRSHGKGIFHKENFDPNSIAMDTLYEVKENDLVVNITFAWEHAIAIANSKDEGGLVSHRFPTYTFVENQSDPIFFRYYVLQKRFKYLLNVISPGGAGRNRVMSKKDFPKLIVKVPPFNEQVAISKVLSSVDNEIEILSGRLKTQKIQKKGLMQQLLTGQKRVI
jgi:type I restriction enzyme S subunit